MEEPEPTPKKYDFKAREFKKDNVSSASQPPMPTAKELAMMAGVAVPKPPPGATEANGGADRAADPNDVFKVLEHNRAVEQGAGFDQVEIRRIKSRRKRDYWLLMLIGNTIMGYVTVVGRDNPFFLVGGIAAMALFSTSVTWIMWQLMNRY